MLGNLHGYSDTPNISSLTIEGLESFPSSSSPIKDFITKIWVLNSSQSDSDSDVDLEDLSKSHFIQILETPCPSMIALDRRKQFAEIPNLAIEDVDLIRRLPKNEWNTLLIHLKDLPLVPKTTVHAFKKGLFNSNIFKADDWPLMAIKAYYEGSITKDRLIFLMLFEELQRKHADEFSTEQLFNDSHKPNPIACELFKDSLRKILTIDQIKKVMHLLKKLPPEDTQFFPILLKNICSFLVPEDYTLGVSNETILLFSPALFEEILKIRFGAQASLPNGVFGFSDASDFESPTHRDIFVPCRYVSSPEKLHGRWIDGSLVIYIHDLYGHLLIESYNPHRAFWIDMAKELKKHDFETEYEQILDRSFLRYVDKEEGADPFDALYLQFIKILKGDALLDQPQKIRKSKILIECLFQAFNPGSTLHKHESLGSEEATRTEMFKKLIEFYDFYPNMQSLILLIFLEQAQYISTTLIQKIVAYDPLIPTLKYALAFAEMNQLPVQAMRRAVELFS